MGRDYSCSAVVGYVVTDLKAFFGAAVRHRDEVSHLEDRYDTRTGKVTHQEKVVERDAGGYVVLGDEEFAVPNDGYIEQEMCEALGALLNARVSEAGHYGDDMLMIIEPDVKEKEGVYDLDDVPFMVAEAKRIGDRCRELGFDPGRAGLHSVLSSC